MRGQVSPRPSGVAQSVERKALNLVVKGSSPFFGEAFYLYACAWLSSTQSFAEADTRAASSVTA